MKNTIKNQENLLWKLAGYMQANVDIMKEASSTTSNTTNAEKAYIGNHLRFVEKSYNSLVEFMSQEFEEAPPKIERTLTAP